MTEPAGRPTRTDKFLEACDSCRQLLGYLYQILKLILMFHDLLS